MIVYLWALHFGPEIFLKVQPDYNDGQKLLPIIPIILSLSLINLQIPRWKLEVDRITETDPILMISRPPRQK